MKNLKILGLLFFFLSSFAFAESAVKTLDIQADKQTEESSSVMETSNSSEKLNKTEKNRTVDQTTTELMANPVENSFSSMSNSKRFIELGLEYPASFGLNLRYLLTDSVYARLGFGFMSEFFLETFERIADTFGHLNEEEAQLLSDTLKNSLYLDVRLAWAPYLKSDGGGPYLELGLSHSRYGKGELSGINLNKALEDDSFESGRYSAKTNTYNANFHVGYQIPFEKLNLNFEIGVIKIFQTQLLEVNAPNAPKKLSDKQKETFQSFLETKGWIFPTFSGWISFAF